MYRLSLIISEIYNKYLPLAEKDGIILNLDFSDTTKEIADPDRVKQYLDQHLDSTLKRSDKGEVTIGVDKSSITITDSATTLSHTACTLLSNKYIEVTSRVGFGTTVKIFFQPRELTSPTSEKPALQVEGISITTSINQTPNQAPAAEGEVKVAAKRGKQRLGLGARLKLKGKKNPTKSNPKTSKSISAETSAKSKTKTAKSSSTSSSTKRLPVKTDRKLAAAARKADREVKHIAKKVSKQSKKAAKEIKKSTNSTKRTLSAKANTKSATKKIKKVELS